MAGVYVRDAGVDELAKPLLEVYRNAGLDADLETARQIVPLVQPRIKKLTDAVPLTDFVFQDEIPLDPELLIGKKMDISSSLRALQKSRAVLAEAEPFAAQEMEQPLRALADELGIKVGPLFGILRGAVTGRRVSPPLFETMEIMGRERTLKQVDKGIALLGELATERGKE
jgi:glutamyl-tRNA synthetase